MVGIGDVAAGAELTQAVPLLVRRFPAVPTAESPVPPNAAVTGVVRAMIGVVPPVDVSGAVAVTLVTIAVARDSAYTDLMFVTGFPPSLTIIVALLREMTTLVPPLADAIVTVYGPPETSVVVL
jgi:hypothetical protein